MVEKNRNNIKLDIVNLLDEIQNGKYSNIQLNYYFSKNNYIKKEKMFITNVINVVIKNLMRKFRKIIEKVLFCRIHNGL